MVQRLMRSTPLSTSTDEELKKTSPTDFIQGQGIGNQNAAINTVCVKVAFQGHTISAAKTKQSKNEPRAENQRCRACVSEGHHSLSLSPLLCIHVIIYPIIRPSYLCVRFVT